jgi:SAM-dependent methyltransferase
MDPERQLDDLAAAAEAMAEKEFGQKIGSEGVEEADRILDGQRGLEDRREALGNVFGAWLGRLALRRWKARWVGLAEPVPPRILVRGLLFSPIDVVRRRLGDPHAPSLGEAIRTLDLWLEAEETGRKDAADRNRAAWDALASDPRFAGPVRFPRDPLSAVDPWIRAEGLKGKDVLCLAAGGGRQGPLHAQAGARVTVVDLSPRQLEHDRRAGLSTVCASMEDLSPLPAASFDIVLQPVSSSFIGDLGRVHAEVARVLRPGGLYVVQHKQPAGLQAPPDGTGLSLPYAEGLPLPVPARATEWREPGTVEFLHTLEALLGGLCRAGFVIEDVVEPPRGDALAPEGSAGHRATFLPPYLRIKARRRPDA